MTIYHCPNCGRVIDDSYTSLKLDRRIIDSVGRCPKCAQVITEQDEVHEHHLQEAFDARQVVREAKKTQSSPREGVSARKCMTPIGFDIHVTGILEEIAMKGEEAGVLLSSNVDFRHHIRKRFLGPYTDLFDRFVKLAETGK